MPKIEILHGRDPDSECALDVWIDGVRVVDFREIDVDPGRGYTREDWDERIRELEERDDPTLSEPFREAALATLRTHADSEYIE